MGGPMPRRGFAACFLCLFVYLAVVRSAAAFVLPTLPTGVTVGTTRFVWVDETRSDPTRSSGPRRVIPQLWYPAAAAAGTAAPYVMELDALASQMRETFEIERDTLAQIVTGATQDAPMASGSEKYPLVIFSHGLGMPRSLYTTYVRALAASGYVVVAIDHPGMGLVAFPDGDVVRPYDPWVKPAPGLRDRSEAQRDEYWKPGRMQLSLDQRFVIDQVGRLAAPKSGSRFAGRIDMTKIAMAGHSDGFLSA